MAIALLEKIIVLIEFFCRQAVQNTRNDLFKAISKTLNECEREAALLKCLAIPDDGIRVAVVSCLFVVPVRDFSYSEIEQITKIMGACNNIGAGQTELVLSTIYWILTKFVSGSTDNPGDENNIYDLF